MTSPQFTPRTKSRALLFGAVGALVAMPIAHAITTLGHGRLVGSASARVDYDSNVFVSGTSDSALRSVGKRKDDLVGTINAEGRYVHEAGIVTFDAGVSAAANLFQDNTDQNSTDPAFDARIGYNPSDKTQANVSISYRRNTIANETVNDRTRSNDASFSGQFTHLTTEKLGFRLTGNYSGNNFLTSGYSDTTTYGLGLHGVYVYSPKLKLLSGINRGESWNSNGPVGRRNPSTRDWRYTVSAEGEFAPKVTGDVSLGLTQHDSTKAGFGDANALFAAAGVSWAASQKTSWNFNVSQDLSLSAADQAAKNLNLSLGVSQRFSDKLSGSASVGYDRSNYVGEAATNSRRDNGYSLRGRLSYILNDYSSVDVAAGYRNNNSSNTTSDYDRVNVGGGVSVRF